MSKIEQKVMASVALVYVVRKLTGIFAFKVYAIVLSVSSIALFVSLPHVAANLLSAQSGGVVSTGAFLLTAILQTKLVVQLALLVGTVAFISIAVDTVRSATSRTLSF